MALVDRRVLVEYAVGGPTLWHERLVLAHVADDRYIIVTPDGDVYEEELGLLNSDIRNIRVRARPGAVPAGVVAAQIYSLPAWGPGEIGDACWASSWTSSSSGCGCRCEGLPGGSPG